MCDERKKPHLRNQEGCSAGRDGCEVTQQWLFENVVWYPYMASLFVHVCSAFFVLVPIEKLPVCLLLTVYFLHPDRNKGNDPFSFLSLSVSPECSQQRTLGWHVPSAAELGGTLLLCIANIKLFRIGIRWNPKWNFVVLSTVQTRFGHSYAVAQCPFFLLGLLSRAQHY